MDLENNRFKFICAKWGSSDNLAKFRVDALFHRQHGYRHAWLPFCMRGICCLIVAWIPTVSPGVEVKFK
ncbi:hypothetical protein [Tardiphaga sp.]|uniref:hypothetical protein n=1 Tax=Tardiphaga sp. TaxID=1926292 RepID=UPI003529E993